MIYDPRPNWYTTANPTPLITLPANRTSTVIFTVPAGYPNTMRSLFMGFYNNMLMLPTGLEYVDDLQTATGDFAT